MYGILLESIVTFIKKAYSEEKWELIRKTARIDQENFSAHQVYAETLIPRIVDACHTHLGIPKEDILVSFGKTYVDFISHYGYDKILKVVGRNFRDFLNGLDNIHEYLRFSYPKLKPPSFFSEQESRSGLILHYRSRRRYEGYTNYVIGMLKTVGRTFYKQDIAVSVLKQESTGNMVHVTYQLSFDNSAYEEQTRSENTANLPLRMDVFYDLFPFHIMFDREMIIRSIGKSLRATVDEITGYDVTQVFSLKKPLVDFSWDSIIGRTNTMFELSTIDPIRGKEEGDDGEQYVWQMTTVPALLTPCLRVCIHRCNRLPKKNFRSFGSLLLLLYFPFRKNQNTLRLEPRREGTIAEASVVPFALGIVQLYRLSVYRNDRTWLTGNKLQPGIKGPCDCTSDLRFSLGKSFKYYKTRLACNRIVGGGLLCGTFFQLNRKFLSVVTKFDTRPSPESLICLQQGKKRTSVVSTDEDTGTFLRLKGQMLFVKEWESMLFLGTAVLQDLDVLSQTGLYLNDLSMHDNSRDLVLAGAQQGVEMKLILKQEQTRTKQLDDALRKLENERHRSRELMYKMLPKPLANDFIARSESNESDISIPEVIDLAQQVTLFTCSLQHLDSGAVMEKSSDHLRQIVSVHKQIELFAERFGFYKIETTQTTFLAASGIPAASDVTEENGCFLAKKVARYASALSRMQVSIALHTGPTVYAIIGSRFPRLCVFGPTLTVTQQIQDLCKPMEGAPQILVTDSLRNRLAKDTGQKLLPGPVLSTKEKDIKTFVLQPDQYGKS